MRPALRETARETLLGLSAVAWVRAARVGIRMGLGMSSQVVPEERRQRGKAAADDAGGDFPLSKLELVEKIRMGA